GAGRVPRARAADRSRGAAAAGGRVGQAALRAQPRRPADPRDAGPLGGGEPRSPRARAAAVALPRHGGAVPGGDLGAGPATRGAPPRAPVGRPRDGGRGGTPSGSAGGAPGGGPRDVERGPPLLAQPQRGVAHGARADAAPRAPAVAVSSASRASGSSSARTSSQSRTGITSGGGGRRCGPKR